MEIASTDTVYEMATKIFNKAIIGQSFAIDGFVIMPDDSVEHKGKLVLEEIERLDKVHNFGNNTGARFKNGIRRRRVRPENVVGDSIAHKAFKWEMRTLDNHKPRYTIWRIQ